MGTKAGFALKLLQWFIRGVQFGCAALILGVYSYFLASLHNHDLSISNQVRAVEGISGVAVIYTAIGLLLLCCVAGLAFASIIAILFDLAFIGAFIYVAIANKNGAGSCNGYLDTPFGKGQSASSVESDKGGFTALPSFHTACRLQTACLAVSIIAIVFFLFSIIVEVVLARHHRKEKRFGPGPRNNYTSGSGKQPGFFGRVFHRKNRGDVDDKNALPEHTHPDQLHPDRQSYATETTAVNHDHHNAYDYNNGHVKQETGYGYAATGAVPAQQPAGYQYEDGVYNRA